MKSAGLALHARLVRRAFCVVFAAFFVTIIGGCAESASTESTEDKTAAGESAASSESELAGDWTLTIDTPRGVQHPVLSIQRNNSGYTATYSGRQGVLTIDEVTRDGNRFAFPLSITVPIGTIEVSYEGVIDGDRMTGVVGNPRGEVPFTGERNAS